MSGRRREPKTNFCNIIIVDVTCLCDFIIYKVLSLKHTHTKKIYRYFPTQLDSLQGAAMCFVSVLSNRNYTSFLFKTSWMPKNYSLGIIFKIKLRNTISNQKKGRGA